MTATLTRYSDSPSQRARLFDFYRSVYSGAPWMWDEKRWEWQTFGNPRRPQEDSDIWLIEENGEIIGHNIFLRYPLRIAGNRYDGLCSANLIVKPGITGRGLGRTMIRMNAELGGIPFAIGMTDNSFSAFAKEGWFITHHIRLYSQILRPWPNLKYLRLSTWKAIMAWPFLWVLSACSRVASGLVQRTFKQVTAREIQSFDPQYDSLWNSFLAHHAFYFERTAEMLNYKFATRSDVIHHKLLFERNGQPVGYGVWRISENPVRNLRMGRIVDLVLDPSLGDNFAIWAVGYLQSKMASQNVDGMAGIASSEQMKRAYRRNGFWFSRPERSGIKEIGFSMTDVAKSFPELWYMTLADADLDDYW